VSGGSNLDERAVKVMQEPAGSLVFGKVLFCDPRRRGVLRDSNLANPSMVVRQQGEDELSTPSRRRRPIGR
jgi:hypothetical protein